MTTFLKIHGARIAGLARAMRLLPARRPVFSNIAAGTHAGYVTATASASFTSKYLLAKAGTDAGQIAVCGASDAPVGVATDEGDSGDIIALKILGAGAQTTLMTASGAVSAESFIYTAASGQVQAEPTTAGTYYLVGRTLTAATGASDLIEVETCVPVKLVVVAAPGLTAGEIHALSIGSSYSQSEVQALREKCQLVETALISLTAALATPSLVKVLGS